MTLLSQLHPLSGAAASWCRWQVVAGGAARRSVGCGRTHSRQEACCSAPALNSLALRCMLRDAALAAESLAATGRAWPDCCWWWWFKVQGEGACEHKGVTVLARSLHALSAIHSVMGPAGSSLATAAQPRCSSRRCLGSSRSLSCWCFRPPVERRLAHSWRPHSPTACALLPQPPPVCSSGGLAPCAGARPPPSSPSPERCDGARAWSGHGCSHSCHPARRSAAVRDRLATDAMLLPP